jgi:streptogramin lyase
MKRNSALTAALGLFGLTVAFAAAQTINEFPVPARSEPTAIVTGPDGNLWFTEFLGDKIGRLTTGGALTEFSFSTGPGDTGHGALSIAVGPDGNLWFAEYYGNNISRITLAGAITEFGLPAPLSHPSGIAAGPDGNLWFTEQGTNQIGRITTAGVITEFPAPCCPRGIAAGPDGNLWFTGANGGTIGRITTAGDVTSFQVTTGETILQDIAAGPDGNLWFTDSIRNEITRITTAGVTTAFTIPTAASNTAFIAAGPDGRMWFVETDGRKVGQITTTGIISEIPVAAASNGGAGIATGPDGAMWLASMNDNIFRISVPACSPPEVPTSPVITPLGNPDGPVTGSDYLVLSWGAPASGTSPGSYEWALNGDTYSAPTEQTTATAPPRGSNDPITLHVQALACLPETAGPALDSSTYSSVAPAAQFSTSGSGRTLTFTDTSSPQATSWLWLFGDGATATTQSTVHTYATASTYSVALVATNGAGSTEIGHQQAVKTAGAEPEASSSTLVFDTADPHRQRLPALRLAEPGKDQLHLISNEDVETIVYLRLLDDSGSAANERRLSIAPGQEAIYDLGAYGMPGTWTLELVSGSSFEAFVEQRQKPERQIGRRDAH